MYATAAARYGLDLQVDDSFASPANSEQNAHKWSPSNSPLNTLHTSNAPHTAATTSSWRALPPGPPSQSPSNTRPQAQSYRTTTAASLWLPEMGGGGGGGGVGALSRSSSPGNRNSAAMAPPNTNFAPAPHASSPAAHGVNGQRHAYHNDSGSSESTQASAARTGIYFYIRTCAV